MKSLYGFKGKRIEPVGSISLPVSFKSLQIARTEFVTFNMVDMHYLFNAIFGRDLFNTFEAALHSAYLCLKVPSLLGVISVHGSQKDARNIEQGFAPKHRNVNRLQQEEDKGQRDMSTSKAEASIDSKIAIESECETKRVPLNPRVLDKTVMISQYLTTEDEIELLMFLDKNNDIFTWKTSDLMGLSRNIIKYKLYVNPSTKPRRQKLRKMSDKKIATSKVEV
jgi:hypothetical protein